jgi:hypothetical protein
MSAVALVASVRPAVPSATAPSFPNLRYRLPAIAIPGGTNPIPDAGSKPSFVRPAAERSVFGQRLGPALLVYQSVALPIVILRLQSDCIGPRGVTIGSICPTRSKWSRLNRHPSSVHWQPIFASGSLIPTFTVVPPRNGTRMLEPGPNPPSSSTCISLLPPRPPCARAELPGAR